MHTAYYDTLKRNVQRMKGSYFIDGGETERVRIQLTVKKNSYRTFAMVCYVSPQTQKSPVTVAV